MRRLVVLTLGAAAIAAVPTAVASPTVRLTILHYVHGCHVWSLNHKAAARIVVHPGTRVAFRSDCPMDFDFRKVSGPRLALGKPRLYAGTARTILFRIRGTYKLAVKNVQSSDELGLGTLGPDNRLVLTVVVK